MLRQVRGHLPSIATSHHVSISSDVFQLSAGALTVRRRSAGTWPPARLGGSVPTARTTTQRKLALYWDCTPALYVPQAESETDDERQQVCLPVLPWVTGKGRRFPTVEVRVFSCPLCTCSHTLLPTELPPSGSGSGSGSPVWRGLLVERGGPTFLPPGLTTGWVLAVSWLNCNLDSCCAERHKLASHCEQVP